MSEQPPDAPPALHDQTDPPDGTDRGAGRAEPEDSPQRRLVEDVRAYEVDPPAPERPAAGG